MCDHITGPLCPPFVVALVRTSLLQQALKSSSPALSNLVFLATGPWDPGWDSRGQLLLPASHTDSILPPPPTPGFHLMTLLLGAQPLSNLSGFRTAHLGETLLQSLSSLLHLTVTS